MRKLLVILGAVALLAVLATAWSGRLTGSSRQTSSGDNQTRLSSQSHTGGPTPSRGNGSQENANGDKDQSGEKRPQKETSPTPPPEPVLVHISVSPECVHPAGSLAVTIRTEPETPGAILSMVIGYSDKQAHGAMHIADADGQGVYVWHVVVSPDVPPGDAIVMVLARARDGSRSGMGNSTFRVAAPGSC